MDIGERIKYFREKKGITVNRLANISGVSQSFVREIELGNKKPTVDTLTDLCSALGVSLKDFFDDDSNASYSDDGLADAIFKLSPEQRKRLAEFIKSMT